MAGLGWVVGGPIGALFGYLLGRAITSDNKQIQGDERNAPHRGPYRNTGTPQDIIVALVVLIAAVLRSDGVVKQSELAYVKKFLLKNYGEERGKDVLHILRDIMNQEFDLGAVCRQIMENTSYDTRYHMVDFLFGIAEADNDISFQEVRTLMRIATNLGINAQDLTSMYARHVGGSYRNYSNDGNANAGARGGKDPYEVLGIKRTCSDDEVRRAFRRMAVKYHPDKMENMGEEIKRNAQRQFQEINQAYETIKAARGMK